MREIVLDIWRESAEVKARFVRDHLEGIVACGERLAAAFAAGAKLMLFGNGGSAADAQHIAAEFVNRFSVDRPPLAALSLSTDTSVLTSVGNDFGFGEVFAKQVRALGKPGDVAIGISTSGGSPNVLRGVREARAMGIHTVGFCGAGGELADCVDTAFRVDARVTARVQETHILLGHMLCEMVDRILFPEAFQPLSPTAAGAGRGVHGRSTGDD